MNSRERFNSVMNFEVGSRTLSWEMGYWAGTIRRWYKEGLQNQGRILESIPSTKTVTGEMLPSPQFDRPRDLEVSTALGLDKGIMRFPIEHWIFPKFEKTIIEETETHVILIDENGIKQKIFKKGGSMPSFLSYPVSGRDDFEKIKERFNPDDPGRLPKDLSDVIKQLSNRDCPIALGGVPVGFFGSLRELMGFEGALTSYYDDPKLTKDILTFLTDFWINLWEKILSYITVDVVHIWEDMSYKGGSLISPAFFREFMLPCYKRLTGFIKSHGVNTIFVDTDGNCTELIPFFIEGGVTGMYPFEVQAGMNVAQIAYNFPTLQIMGGIDKTKLKSKELIDKELEEKVPFVLKRGGYIPSLDHVVPPDISWELFVYYRNKLNQMIRNNIKK
ncbi:hypothetical protein ES705_21079 [subsurface metagenome]|nr:hypothetical protein [Clostridia bacterium]